LVHPHRSWQGPDGDKRFKLVSVGLLNGEQVGAIEPWGFPGQDGPPSPAKTDADRSAEELYLNLLGRLTLSGVGVTLGPSTSGAPTVFARKPKPKPPKSGSKHLQTHKTGFLPQAEFASKSTPLTAAGQSMSEQFNGRNHAAEGAVENDRTYARRRAYARAGLVSGLSFCETA
jgi:hypothetical protein